MTVRFGVAERGIGSLWREYWYLAAANYYDILVADLPGEQK